MKQESGTITRKRSYHHGDLPAALIEAAELELSEKGVEAFSLRGVAKRAGVSHGAPAHHFGDAQGLLTALAASGYERFTEFQRERQRAAPRDAKSQLAAAGLGYIDFAIQRPALFRLMFSSERPDRRDRGLASKADAAFEKLVRDVTGAASAAPANDQQLAADVIAAWAMVHGLSDLMIGDRFNRLNSFAAMPGDQRDQLFSELILRCIFHKKDKPDDQ